MLRRLRAPLLVLLSTQLVVGCGGGGDVDAAAASSVVPEPTLGPEVASIVSSSSAVANLPPVFTSSGAAIARINPSFGLYVAVALDPEGAAVTYQISGGPDAGNFTIDPGSGFLRFLAPPNAEFPNDANGDNVYLLKISASDGVNQTTQDTIITVGRDTSPYK